jgi:hydrogenase/urease accessory protein HupE
MQAKGMGTLRRALPWVAGLAFLLLANGAEAHTVISTKGPFISGIKHFFISLDDVLAVAAVGILASQDTTKAGGRVFWVLPCAWLAAGLAGLARGQPVPGGELLSAGSLLVAGGLAAWSLSLPAWVLLGLAGLTGALHGFFNGAAMQPDSFGAGLAQLAGIGVSVALVGAYPNALLEIFKGRWARIVARVMGSWIAATGLLLIGWTLRGPR